MTGTVQVFHGMEDVAAAAAQRFSALASQSCAERGAFHVALAGGSTPRRLYALLATPAYAEAIAWDKVHIYFGDERCVPPEHADSNYRMAHEALLSRVPVPATNIHRMAGELPDAAEAAADYARQLQALLPQQDGQPCFDLVLLGMGDDGHTASLFPGTTALEESSWTVAAVYVDKLSAWRITLSFTAINHARHVLLLVTGAGKAATLAQVFAPGVGERFPVQRVRPRGRLEWLLDEAAAAQLPDEARS